MFSSGVALIPCTGSDKSLCVSYNMKLGEIKINFTNLIHFNKKTRSRHYSITRISTKSERHKSEDIQAIYLGNSSRQASHFDVWLPQPGVLVKCRSGTQ